MSNITKLARQAAFATAIVVAGTQVQAASVTVDFPSASSTINASAGTFFFLDTHFARETFTNTGLASVSNLSVALGLASDNLNSGASVQFDVLLNGTDVGDISFDQNDALGVFNFNFAFAPVVGNGTYTIELDVKNNVPGGQGSVSFDRVGSTATLANGTVPEPTSLALVGLALGTIGLARRARRSQVLKA